MASEVHADERRDVAPEAASSNLVARPNAVRSGIAPASYAERRWSDSSHCDFV